MTMIINSPNVISKNVYSLTRCALIVLVGWSKFFMPIHKVNILRLVLIDAWACVCCVTVPRKHDTRRGSQIFEEWHNTLHPKAVLVIHSVCWLEARNVLWASLDASLSCWSIRSPHLIRGSHLQEDCLVPIQLGIEKSLQVGIDFHAADWEVDGDKWKAWRQVYKT